MTQSGDTVAAVRRFNRFYTRAIGALDRGFLGGPYTLAETRVLWEIAHAEGVTPTAIRAALDLDAGYLSRMVGRFERDGLVARQPVAGDGRSIALRLTDHGRAVFGAIDRKQVAKVEGLIGGLDPAQRQRLAAVLAEAETLLAPRTAATPVILRPHRPGDLGWVVERHGVLYAREYGWGSGIEAVTARIVADFLEKDAPARERCWIADRAGGRLGCMFMVEETETVARLRLLLLEPAARGLGLGRRLVDEGLAFARAAGYREVVLWTHAVLTSARRIYAEMGFQLEETWTHDDFGAEEVSETWRLKLGT